MSTAKKSENQRGLTPQQERALQALLTTSSIEDAARQAGLSDRTLHTYLRDPVFQAAYRQMRQQVFAESVHQLQKASRDAVATLQRNLRCGQPAIEVRAAAVLLAEAYKGTELLEMEARLAALEQAQEGKKA